MKQVIIVIQSLKLPKGKLAAQAAHASVEAAHRAEKSVYEEWRRQGMAKIVVKVDALDELYTYIQQAKDEGIATAIITDAGKTTVAPGTVTCGAIGPGREAEIDAITKDLSLL